jgi:signal transduction histidine kinase
MVIEYTATPRDVAALYSYTRKHSLKLALIFYGLPIAMGLLVLLGHRSPTHSLTIGDWFVALVWAALLFFLFPLMLRLRTKKDKRTLSIQPDMLSTQIGKFSGDVPWARVDRLYVTDEHIFLIGKNMNGFAIPRRAFADETQRKEFVGLCEQYIQAGRSG